jgi:hypothetical protein
MIIGAGHRRLSFLQFLEGKFQIYTKIEKVVEEAAGYPPPAFNQG